MANKGQPTSNMNSQRVQHLNIQQQTTRDRLPQNNFFDEKKSKKVVRRRPMENEKDRQKAQYETSRNELKDLLAQFGSKAKAADELDKDVSKLHGNIESLLEKVQGKANKPYEPIVHGTYDVDQTDSWNLLRTITTLIYDFFSEIMKGGRGFGSPNYDGSVPI
ncbi:25783_t:CDS:2 [Gigaspora margarita]|uniref:25783_t:CDS:1 n=1 Tax=Gigaspora margarita TaxID=4874 RepID=A0ABN7URP2_GIGMA|nr:25783_t:CDS:2 [Gigaspora margarita]